MAAARAAAEMVAVEMAAVGCIIFRRPLPALCYVPTMCDLSCCLLHVPSF